MKNGIILFNIDSKLANLINDSEYSLFNCNRIEDIFSNLDKNKIILLDLDLKFNYKEIFNKAKDKNTVVIGLISPTRVRIATKLLKDGLTDYIVKDLNIDINDRIGKFFSSKSNFLKDKEFSFFDILNSNTRIKKTFNNLVKLSNANIPILIQGEQGCEHLSYAKTIHNLSDRKNNEFLEIFCPTLTLENINDILVNRIQKFNCGTIFFEDIDLLDQKVQNLLFKILDKLNNSNIKIISSSNKFLKEEVINCNFREDLYFLINGSCLNIPSLKDVRNIIPILVKNLYKYYSIEHNKNIKGITNKALKILESYDWPGNIKEMKTVINKAIILTNNDILNEKDFFYLKNNIFNTEVSSDIYLVSLKNIDGSLKTMEVLEKEIIEKYLKINNGNITEVSKLLDIGRATLYRKIENE